MSDIITKIDDETIEIEITTIVTSQKRIEDLLNQKDNLLRQIDNFNNQIVIIQNEIQNIDNIIVEASKQGVDSATTALSQIDEINTKIKG